MTARTRRKRQPKALDAVRGFEESGRRVRAIEYTAEGYRLEFSDESDDASSASDGELFKMRQDLLRRRSRTASVA